MIGILIVWIHGVHRAHRWTEDDHGSTATVVATVGLFVGIVALLAIDGAYLFMLFGVFGFTFGYGRNVISAAVLSAVLTAIWIGGWIFHGLPLGAIATPVFVWVVANAINVLSSRISEQNIERGELIDRLTQTRTELAVAERERGVLHERNRLAREIHDTLAQGFTSVVLLSEATASQLETLPPERVSHSLSLIAGTARENLDEARRLIAAQPPAALDEGSLVDALAAVGDDVARRTNASLDLDLPSNAAFGGSEEVVLLRVAQEATGNIAKYANAAHVGLALMVEDGWAILRVVDDGDGFVPKKESGGGVGTGNADPTLSGGKGLDFMAERAVELDGELTIDSVPGEGTTVTLRIPVVKST